VEKWECLVSPDTSLFSLIFPLSNCFLLAIPKERYFVVLDKKIEYYEADAKGGLMCRTGALSSKRNARSMFGLNSAFFAGGMPLFHCCVVQPNEQVCCKIFLMYSAFRIGANLSSHRILR